MEETEIVITTKGIQLIRIHRKETVKMTINIETETENTDHTERIAESGKIEVTSANTSCATETTTTALP